MSDLPNPYAPKFPVIAKHPTYDDIRGNFGGGDYAKWLSVTAASFPLGYVFGALFSCVTVEGR